MKSQLITITEGTNGVVTAATKDAELLDVVTTSLSANSGVIGLHGLLQRGLFFIGGMATQSKLKYGTFNFLK